MSVLFYLNFSFSLSRHRGGGWGTAGLIFSFPFFRLHCKGNEDSQLKQIISLTIYWHFISLTTFFSCLQYLNLGWFTNSWNIAHVPRIHYLHPHTYKCKKPIWTDVSQFLSVFSTFLRIFSASWRSVSSSLPFFSRLESVSISATMPVSWRLAL